MKFSNETINILRNFQTINQAIVLNKGNVIKTISPTETIFARAEVVEKFPKDVGIYDLSRFLGILSLDKESDIKFNENFILIKQGSSQIKYSYGEQSLIKVPPSDNVKLPTKDVVFNLSSETLEAVMKAMSILGFSEIAITGEDGKLMLQTLSVKNDNSDIYSTELGETNSNFIAIIEAEKLKLLPGNYEVSITKQGLAHFVGDGIEYGIAINARSKFDE
jgi:hypothetical protein